MKSSKKIGNYGFTLVELICVLVILAILAAILVPALLGYINKAKAAKIQSEGHAMMVAFVASFVEVYGTSSYNSDKKSGLYTYNGSANDGSVPLYYCFTNFALYNADPSPAVNHKKTSHDIYSDAVALSILNYTDELKVDYYGDKFTNGWHSGNKNFDYTQGMTVKDAAAGLGNSYAIYIIISEKGEVAEFDYMRDGFLFQMKDGKTYTYDSTDTKHGFPTKNKEATFDNKNVLIKPGIITTHP